MANPEKGEVSVEIDGATYTLALTLNTMIELSDLFEMGFDDVIEAAAKGDKDSPKYLRGLIWGALRRHHPDITIKEAGDLLSIRSLKDIESALGKAVSASGPDPRDVKEMGTSRKGNPTKARVKEAGTGASSTSAPGISG